MMSMAEDRTNAAGDLDGLGCYVSDLHVTRTVARHAHRSQRGQGPGADRSLHRHRRPQHLARLTRRRRRSRQRRPHRGAPSECRIVQRRRPDRHRALSRSELQRCDEYARQGTVARPHTPRLRARVAIRVSSRWRGSPRPALPARRPGRRIRPPRSRPPRNRSHRARRFRPSRHYARRA
jgi:hypothetical protein